MRITELAALRRHWSDGDGATTREITMGTLGPLTFRADIAYAGGAVHVIFVTAAPTDDDACFLVQLVARDDTESDAPAAGLLEVDGRVIEEDRWACERNNPEFSLHLPDEVHLPCDRLSVAYRRHLAALT